jgi:hypothetical protein
LTVSRLPAIASRSGEAGGEENGQTQCARGAHVAFGEVVSTMIFLVASTIAHKHSKLLGAFFRRRRIEYPNFLLES